MTTPTLDQLDRSLAADRRAASDQALADARALWAAVAAIAADPGAKLPPDFPAILARSGRDTTWLRARVRDVERLRALQAESVGPTAAEARAERERLDAEFARAREMREEADRIEQAARAAISISVDAGRERQAARRRAAEVERGIAQTLGESLAQTGAGMQEAAEAVAEIAAVLGIDWQAGSADRAPRSFADHVAGVRSGAVEAPTRGRKVVPYMRVRAEAPVQIGSRVISAGSVLNLPRDRVTWPLVPVADDEPLYEPQETETETEAAPAPVQLPAFEKSEPATVEERTRAFQITKNSREAVGLPRDRAELDRVLDELVDGGDGR